MSAIIEDLKKNFCPFKPINVPPLLRVLFEMDLSGWIF